MENKTEVIRPAAADLGLKWFMFDQNNSGGSYVINDAVAPFVAFQARNAKDAIRMARSVFDDYSDWCPCCGERWSYYVDDNDGTDVPMICGESVYECEKSWLGGPCILYHADGKIERVTIGEKKE